MILNSTAVKYLWALLCINIVVNEVVAVSPAYIDYENSIRDLYEFLMQKEALEDRLGLHQVSRKSSRTPSLRLRFGRRSLGPPIMAVPQHSYSPEEPNEVDN